MQFRKNVLGDENPDTDNLRLHEYADIGVKGINALLGWEMNLETSEDEEGRVNHLKFTSQLIKYDSRGRE